MQDTPDLSRARWRKSTTSSGGNGCVETTHAGEIYAVRDSKNPNGPKLLFNRTEWKAFLDGAKAGEFDYDLS